jgi:hypothetical protein
VIVVLSPAASKKTMGGSAFNLEAHGFITSRMNLAQYKALSDLVLPLVRLYFCNVAVPPEAPEKLSYGDLDIFVSRPLNLHPHDAILQLCTNALGDRCKRFIYSVGTSNIAVELEDGIFQVDVHIVDKDEMWDIDFWMHSYGDTGMIVSSILKAWKLRLSASRGFWVDIGESACMPFVLSLDMERIAKFVGLDWKRYQEGFCTTVELFEWIEGVTLNGKRVGVKAKGKLEKKAHDDRPMWLAFWTRGDDTAYEPTEEEQKLVFEQAVECFGKREEFGKVLLGLARDKEAKEKLNGFRVMEWTGAKGRALGELMKTLKKDGRLSKDGLVAMGLDEVEKTVLEVWGKFCIKKPKGVSLV